MTSQMGEDKEQVQQREQSARIMKVSFFFKASKEQEEVKCKLAKRTDLNMLQLVAYIGLMGSICDFIMFGFARSKMTDEESRNIISRTLTCRIDKRANCEDKMDYFLKRCFHHSGLYNYEDNFAELDIKLKEKEVVRCASLRASFKNGGTRVIVEKPFGRD